MDLLPSGWEHLAGMATVLVTVVGVMLGRRMAWPQKPPTQKPAERLASNSDLQTCRVASQSRRRGSIELATAAVKDIVSRLAGKKAEEHLIVEDRLASGTVGMVFSGTYKGQPCAVRVISMLSAPAHAHKISMLYELLRTKAGQHPNLVPLLHTEVNPHLAPRNTLGPQWLCTPPPSLHNSPQRNSMEEGAVQEPESYQSCFSALTRHGRQLAQQEGAAAQGGGSGTGTGSGALLKAATTTALAHFTGRGSVGCRVGAHTGGALLSSSELRGAVMRRGRASVDVGELGAHADKARDPGTLETLMTARASAARTRGTSFETAQANKRRGALLNPTLWATSQPPKTPPMYPNELYFVSELCPLGSLEGYLLTHELPLHARALLALDVAQALAHLHERRVMHTDLKLANCLLVADESRAGTGGGLRARLADVGLAALLDADESRLSSARARPEELALQAPEALMEGRITAEGDVYAYGCLLWRLAAHGAQLFPAAEWDACAVLQQVVVGHARPEFPDSTPLPWVALAEE
eukprot:CAMPEP_0202862058 /NCGR_PEP_ID=MMETSP1391-20130828/3241_1 /ASSEMBLY_ACC=CAM_ASM_000867 /TAXON_ID=1034604 /ORGANISM="Chlamydomonas leiostraca, Strain SAG 11-49" /LENGTH=525 /DNA_ID=CAMNT_0049541541 /DNA_START=157 /DNA_END=1731 /DNA_ORIENTATION=-